MHDWLEPLARRLGCQGAEDLAQEARLALLKRPPTGDEHAWLKAVLKNLALQVRRSEGRRARRERVAARPETIAPDERIEVREAVGRLDEPYRSTVLMRYFDGLSPKEIAERERVPASTIRNRIHRALKILRRALALPLLWLLRPRQAAAGLTIAFAAVTYAEGGDAAPPAASPPPARHARPRPGPPERARDRGAEVRPVQGRPRRAPPSL